MKWNYLPGLFLRPQNLAESLAQISTLTTSIRAGCVKSCSMLSVNHPCFFFIHECLYGGDECIPVMSVNQGMSNWSENFYGAQIGCTTLWTLLDKLIRGAKTHFLDMKKKNLIFSFSNRNWPHDTFFRIWWSMAGINKWALVGCKSTCQLIWTKLLIGCLKHLINRATDIYLQTFWKCIKSMANGFRIW